MGCFVSDAELRRKEYKCMQCSRVYKQQQSLYRHVKYECGKEPGFYCPQSFCNYRAKQRETMKTHVRLRHPELFIFFQKTNTNIYRTFPFHDMHPPK